MRPITTILSCALVLWQPGTGRAGAQPPAGAPEEDPGIEEDGEPGEAPESWGPEEMDGGSPRGEGLRERLREHFQRRRDRAGGRPDPGRLPGGGPGGWRFLPGGVGGGGSGPPAGGAGGSGGAFGRGAWRGPGQPGAGGGGSGPGGAGAAGGGGAFGPGGGPGGGGPAGWPPGPGGGRGWGGGGGGGGGFEAVTPEETRRARTFLETWDPRRAREIDRFQDREPFTHAQLVRKALREMQELERVEQTDPEHHARLMEERRLNVRVLEKAEARRKAEGEAATALEAEMRDLLGRQFDLKMKMHERKAAEMEAKLGELRSKLEARRKSKDDIVDRRLKTLTGQLDEFEW